MSNEREKQRAAEAAAALVEPGMTIGLGTGSTVGFLLPALARRALSVRCVASSVATEHAARALGLQVEPFDRLERLDLVIDGADQIAPDGWLVKGGGGAHTREKILAGAADRFVVIADASKLVPALHAPVPLELLAFGLAGDAAPAAPHHAARAAPAAPTAASSPTTRAPSTTPRRWRRGWMSTPGVVAHGLFPPALVSEALVARGDEVERLVFRS